MKKSFFYAILLSISLLSNPILSFATAENTGTGSTLNSNTNSVIPIDFTPADITLLGTATGSTISLSWTLHNGTAPYGFKIYWGKGINLDNYFWQYINLSSVRQYVIPEDLLPSTGTYNAKICIYTFVDNEKVCKKFSNDFVFAINTSITGTGSSIPSSTSTGTILPSKPTIQPSTEDTPISLPFVDIPENYFARSYIAKLYNIGLLTGKTQFRFYPESSMNRAEFISLLMRSLYKADIITTIVTTPPFQDVPQSIWYAKAVTLAKEKGIIHGYLDGTFRPTSLITRAEAITLLMRAFNELLDTNNTLSFTDVREQWQKAPIAAALRIGIIGGYGNGLFGPNDHLTRGQAVKIIYKTLIYYKLLDAEQE